MKTRKIGSFLGLGAFALLGSPALFGVAHAQESLAGLGAASGIGATLGASAATSFNTPRVPRGLGAQNALIDEAGDAGGIPGMRGMGGAGGGAAAAPAAAPAQLYGLNVRKTVSQLRQVPTVSTAKGGFVRRRESKVARQRRIARLSPAARKREIQKAYKIPPRGWLSQYLPQDRYKFGKDWQFVSTEDSSYYFRPQALAARKFNPNRVIGFHSWQDAMLAGYKPDPLSKPEPAPKVIQLGALSKGDNYYRYVGYVYSGQINPASLDATVRYSQLVAKKLRTHQDAKFKVSETIDYILAASINGDQSQLPIFVGREVTTAGSTANTAQAGGMMGGMMGGMRGGTPQFPGMAGAPGGMGMAGTGFPQAGGDIRADNFNSFSNNAGRLANVPANR